LRIKDFISEIILLQLIIWLYLLPMTGCRTEKAHYTIDDFYRIEKIDAHVHINDNTPFFTDQARRVNFKLLTINVDYPDFPLLPVQEKIAQDRMNSDPDLIAFAATFSMTGWDEPDWQKKVLGHLDSMFSAGASAVKVWKNIGMDFRASDGAMVMIDNPRFDAIFAHIREKKIPVIGHMGEPKSCWQPAAEIPIKYIRNYFIDHPQYHMYLHPEMPSYEDQMQVRDNMLEKNRDMEFVGAHLASLEWSVDELARFLDRFPRADVDIAARMGNIQYQSSQNREKVRKFFINYQDRILYGTDLVYSAGMSPSDFISNMNSTWLGDWKYLVTDSLMTTVEFEGKFQGLHLPAAVLDKIYSTNAKRKFTRAWPKN